jgi:membrane associated rhomboid family serine protease
LRYTARSMFPVRDINPAARTPVVTWTLIALNGLAFLATWVLGSQLLADALGLVPARLFFANAAWVWITPLTSMFIHASWAHVLGNLWFLHVFGDNVEDHLGHARFLALYLLSGLSAAVLHVALAPLSPVPLVGASGAIAGVLGAYMFRFPRAPILAWFVVFLVELPAFAFLVVWFGYQLWMTLGTFGGQERGGVAFAAHVGGFIAGALIDRILEGPRQKQSPGPIN